MGESPLKVGVVGVGSMGSNHARIYHELPETTLVGLADADEGQARDVATRYNTSVLDVDELLATAEAVSIATPTQHHYDMAMAAIDRDVHLLVEKPFVETPARGQELIDRAEQRGLTLQVGHVERFNPAVQTALDVTADQDIVAVDARRLGPPINRGISDGVVLDLMIHDIDVLLALVGCDVDRVASTGAREGQYFDAIIRFENGVVGGLTSSRVTQRKVRKLSITTGDSQVEVDYLAQSIEIHRQSYPAFVESSGDVRYRHEQVTEYPTVDSGEPLRRELESFVAAIQNGDPPAVDGRAGLEAISLAHRIVAAAEEPVTLAEAPPQ